MAAMISAAGVFARFSVMDGAPHNKRLLPTGAIVLRKVVFVRWEGTMIASSSSFAWRGVARGRNAEPLDGHTSRIP